MFFGFHCNLCVFLAILAIQGCRSGQISGDISSSDPLAKSSQLLLISARFWSSRTGNLRLFARDSLRSPWIPLGPPIKINLGPTGMGWGAGLHGKPGVRFPVSTVRNRRIPAGVFRVLGVRGWPTGTLDGLQIKEVPSEKNGEGVQLLFGKHGSRLTGTDSWQVPLGVPPPALRSIVCWLDRDSFPVVVVLPLKAEREWRLWGLPNN